MLKTILKIAAPILLVAYIAVALAFTLQRSGSEPATGVQIVVNDSACHRFVTAEQVARELGDFPSRVKTMPIGMVNTDSIERLLKTIDKIEDARVVCLTDRRIFITINPMEPVARVFPTHGSSYYINRNGKRIEADPRYHIDVPVIQGNFTDSSFTAVTLLPLLDWLDAHPEWNSLVSSIKADSPRDIILLPIIRGHVINLGDLQALDNKFDRLHTFYREVLPVRGYETFDTISVKWNGQVVAKLRNRKLAEPGHETDIDEETIDLNTMLANEDTAPVSSIRQK